MGDQQRYILFALAEAGQLDRDDIKPIRITSYNVCYTKLLRSSDTQDAAMVESAGTLRRREAGHASSDTPKSVHPCTGSAAAVHGGRRSANGLCTAKSLVPCGSLQTLMGREASYNFV